MRQHRGRVEVPVIPTRHTGAMLAKVWKAIVSAVILSVAVSWLAVRSHAGDALPVDVELILAVDASGSVDDGEFALQLEGIAAGFRDPAVLQAIKSGPLGRIAVTLNVWADSSLLSEDTEWFLVRSEDTAEAFARRVEQFQRSVGGGTGIGHAIAHNVHRLTGNAYEGTRKVIDVSGDGPETPIRHMSGILLPQARQMAAAWGVTVNGLAIESDEPDIVAYYRGNVLVGPGSFVIAASDFNDYARAMREKLLRELSPSISLAPDQRPVRFANTSH